MEKFIILFYNFSGQLCRTTLQHWNNIPSVEWNTERFIRPKGRLFLSGGNFVTSQTFQQGKVSFSDSLQLEKKILCSRERNFYTQINTHKQLCDCCLGNLIYIGEMLHVETLLIQTRLHEFGHIRKLWEIQSRFTAV